MNFEERKRKSTLLSEVLNERLKGFIVYKRSKKKIPNLTMLYERGGHEILLNSIELWYKKKKDSWTIHFPDIGVDGVFYRSDSQLNSIEYLKEVLSINTIVENTIKEIMPSSIVESDFQSTANHLLMKFLLLEKLKSETNYKVYIDEGDMVVIEDCSLVLILTASSTGEIDTVSKPNGKYIYIPVDPGSGDDAEVILNSTFEKYELINIIRNYSLQSIYTQSVNFKKTDVSFKEIFNKNINRLLFDTELFESSEEYYLNLDYQEEFIKANPNVDIKEIFYMAIRLRTGEIGLKALSGYYILKSNEKSFEHLTFEEYDKRNNLI